MGRFFRYAMNKRLMAFWLSFGLRQESDGVTLLPDGEVDGDVRLLQDRDTSEQRRRRTSAGITDGGPRSAFVTFGTNADPGVCVHFRHPVGSPSRRKGHSALTVTVADLDGLVGGLDAGGP